MPVEIEKARAQRPFPASWHKANGDSTGSRETKVHMVSVNVLDYDLILRSTGATQMGEYRRLRLLTRIVRHGNINIEEDLHILAGTSVSYDEDIIGVSISAVKARADRSYSKHAQNCILFMD